MNIKAISIKPFYNPNIIEAGCDEAGRGCLAGPVVAATVILPQDFNISFLNDSKKLSANKRYELRKYIEQEAIEWKVSMIHPPIIDKINILNASIFAMHKAIEQLSITPGLLLIDGHKFYPYKNIPYKCIIKGDEKYAAIAAAAILAKTYRDDFMIIIHKKFPCYNWQKNKGYPTHAHRSAIQKIGITKYHRKSFKYT